MKIIENVSLHVSRRGFLHGALASGVFVLSARFIPAPLLAAEGEAAAPAFQPSLWMSVASDGTVTIVAHRFGEYVADLTELSTQRLDDMQAFLDQMRQIRKLGSMQSILKMLPSIGPFQGIQQMAGQVDESQFTRIEAIINSMTKQERDKHEIISGSRRKRIARGSGTSVQEVNQLLRQYAQMRKMFKSAGKGGGMQRRMMGALGGMRGMGR